MYCGPLLAVPPIAKVYPNALAVDAFAAGSETE
jgi:hypothetical protein